MYSVGGTMCVIYQRIQVLVGYWFYLSIVGARCPALQLARNIPRYVAIIRYVTLDFEASFAQEWKSARPSKSRYERISVSSTITCCWFCLIALRVARISSDQRHSFQSQASSESILTSWFYCFQMGNCDRLSPFFDSRNIARGVSGCWA